jgi:hypothetical protein
MSELISTEEALGHVHAAITALEKPYTKHRLNSAACMAYLDLIDARYRLERAVEKEKNVSSYESISDDDYNLRGF